MKPSLTVLVAGALALVGYTLIYVGMGYWGQNHRTILGSLWPPSLHPPAKVAAG